jgi:hypothetical protein
MPTPALSIPVRANLDDFKKSMRETSSLATTATKTIAKKFIDMNASVLATGGAAGTAALGFRSILGVLGPLSAGIAAVSGVFKLMSLATELAQQKIEDFNRTAEQAGKVGLSTDFFQRMTKSGEQLKLTVDEVNAALDRFADKSKSRLGGSSLDQSIAELTGAGNFRGNAGVSAVSGALGSEEKLRATVRLITEALAAGERLAALDLAEKVFGSKVADNLRSNNQYLQEMLQQADKIAATEIVSNEEIGRAIELKNRMEEAQRILSEKFKPIQDDLAKLGMNYQQSWVDIYTNLAKAVSVANDLYAALKEIPDIFARAGNSPFWAKFNEFMKARGLMADPESMGIMPVTSTGEGSDANRRLTALLQNREAVRKAMQDAVDVETKVRGDKSKAPASAPATAPESRDAFDSAIASAERRLAVIKAETDAIGQNSEVRERARTVAVLEEAAKRANADAGKKNTEVTEEQRASIERLATATYNAAAAARKAQQDYQAINAGLQFAGQQTVDVIESILDKSKTGTQIVADLAKALRNAILQSLILGQGPLAGLMGMASGTGGVGGLFGMLGGLRFAEGGDVRGPGTGTSDSIPARLSNGEFVVRASAARQHRDLLHAINSGRVRRFAEGGEVGDIAAVPPEGAAAAGGVTVNSTINLNFADAAQANSLDPSKAQAFGREVEAAVQRVVAREMRTQIRPGGILRG